MANEDSRLPGSRIVRKSLAATVVPGSSTKMLAVDVRGLSRIFAHVTTAVAALTGFAVKVKATDAATAASLYSAAADFTSPQGLLVGASGDLTTQNGAGWFAMDVVGLDSVEFWATSGGTATLAIELGGS